MIVVDLMEIGLMEITTIYLHSSLVEEEEDHNHHKNAMIF